MQYRLVHLFVLLFCPFAARADEGMWLINRPPVQRLKAEHRFDVAPEWLEHLQKSAVKFGASASLVSLEGLLLTNHHVGFGHLEKLSTPERNLLETGFYARTRAEELPCPDAEAKVLWSIEDVTERVDAAATPAMSPSAASEARRKAILTIEKESQDATKLDSHVVKLYHGARYHLYRYKRYTDVRLVFAPEYAVAFFGGDNDNFEYPRWCLDVCLFRVYENGEPLRPEHYLRWSESGASEGDLAFVVGHPGRTRRLHTLDHARFMRDVELPFDLARIWRRQAQLEAFSARTPENARVASGELFGVRNGRKSLTGQLAAMHAPPFLARKAEAERTLRQAVDADPEKKAKWGGAWDRIAAAQRVHKELHRRHSVVRGLTRRIPLAQIALDLVRLAEERPKPNAERLPEYGDAGLPRLFQDLYSPAPIYDALEIDRLSGALSFAAEELGAEDEWVLKLLAGKSPRERAAELVRGTKLKDVAARKKLADGGRSAIDESDDVMIRFAAAAVDPVDRALRKRYEDEVEAVEREGYADIAAAKFAAYGESVYPDATATLRLSFGTVKGYTEEGVPVPPFTRLAGLFERWGQRRGQSGFELPRRWLEARNRLDASTPYNFILTADIVGGNSGSPVVDRAGRLVGLIFDSNLHGLGDTVQYDDRFGRAVAVDSRAILEALRKVYDADALADELTGK